MQADQLCQRVSFIQGHAAVLEARFRDEGKKGAVVAVRRVSGGENGALRHTNHRLCAAASAALFDAKAAIRRQKLKLQYRTGVITPVFIAVQSVELCQLSGCNVIHTAG